MSTLERTSVIAEMARLHDLAEQVHFTVGCLRNQVEQAELEYERLRKQHNALREWLIACHPGYLNNGPIGDPVTDPIGPVEPSIPF